MIALVFRRCSLNLVSRKDPATPLVRVLLTSVVFGLRPVYIVFVCVHQDAESVTTITPTVFSIGCADHSETVCLLKPLKQCYYLAKPTLRGNVYNKKYTESLHAVWSGTDTAVIAIRTAHNDRCRQNIVESQHFRLMADETLWFIVTSETDRQIL